jgi:uncharacterized Zn-finger protein
MSDELQQAASGAGACTTQHFDIRECDLPLSCPMPSQAVWNAHPRVFLTLDEHDQAVCPYCGTHYTLHRTAVTK